MLAIIGVLIGTILISAVPRLQPTTYDIELPPAQPVNLPWPAYGQAAAGAQGYGVLASNVANRPAVPTASVIKVLTALAVLKVHPLELGESGPNITITQEDVDSFNAYTLTNGAVTKVVAGQQISQYHALQAMLIRSANNMADTLARWAYGSVEEYVAAANEYAKELGLQHTRVADATGFSAQTVSTAEDLVILGEHALNNPVIGEIVATWQAEIPEAGLITNSNLFLDFQNNGVIGIKSGDTPEAGGVYLVAARYQLQEATVTVIGALMAAPSHFAAQQDTMPLLQAVRDNFHSTRVLEAGQVVGSYELPWNGRVEAQAERELKALAWGDRPVELKLKLDTISPNPVFKTSRVGEASVELGTSTASTPLKLTQPLKTPSWWWRLQQLWHNFSQ